MKISLLIAAIIFGIIALFAVPRRNEIKLLTTEWTELEDQALALDVPTDPKVPFSSDRIRSDSARAAKTEKVNDFADELIAFFHKMNALEKSGGDQSEFQTEVAEIIGKLTELSPDELRLLVKTISVDSTVDDQSKLELIGFSTMMLASDNPEAALAIALEAHESLGEKGEMEGNMKQNIIRAAAQQDLTMAIGTLGLEKDPSAYSSLASTVTSDNVDAFRAALRDSGADATQKKTAFASLARAPLMKDFETASGWIEKSGMTDDERASILSNLSYYGVKK